MTINFLSSLILKRLAFTSCITYKHTLQTYSRHLRTIPMVQCGKSTSSTTVTYCIWLQSLFTQ